MQLPLVAAGRRRHPRRPARAAGRRDEPRRRAAVDPLAGPGDPGLARGGQCLLHGLSVHAAADARPPLAARTGWSWPRRLRSKWLAVVLLVLFLWAYEAFALWDSPWWTAWIAIGYFVAAFVIDGLFRGASFCKYLCPIGQFNFVQSLVSPLEVKVRDPDVCAVVPDQGLHPRPRRHPRLRAEPVPAAQGGQPGLHVLPRLRPRLPARQCRDARRSLPRQDLWNDRPPLRHRPLRPPPDLAALIVVLVFGAFANAAGMVGPVVGWQERLASLAGQFGLPCWRRPLFYLLALVVLPLLTVGGAAALSRRWGRLRGRHPGGGDALRVCPGPAGFRHVAGALQLSLPDELRHGRPRRAAVRRGSRADVAGSAGVGRALLPPRGGLAAPAWRSSSWTWGCSCPSTPATAWRPRSKALAALGTAPGALVRGGGLDRPPADADARHSLREQG